MKSFGTGANVKLPGSAPDKPNIYDFSTTYEQMYQDLCKKDKHLYPVVLSLVSYFCIFLFSSFSINIHNLLGLYFDTDFLDFFSVVVFPGCCKFR